jgi:hypothetical protein
VQKNGEKLVLAINRGEDGHWGGWVGWVGRGRG